jgi:hypothetical protein
MATVYTNKHLKLHKTSTQSYSYFSASRQNITTDSQIASSTHTNKQASILKSYKRKRARSFILLSIMWQQETQSMAILLRGRYTD